MNGVFLVALCLSIFLEAIQRFVEPQEVSQPKLVLIVGCFGLASNILGLALFHDHSHSHGQHEHAHQHETQNNLSRAEQGQAGSAHADAAVSNESGNIADVLPQSVIGAWSSSPTNLDFASPARRRDIVKSDEGPVATAGSPPPSARRKTSSVSGQRGVLGHRRRRSGSHTRYSSMGEVPSHLHPASFRNEIIAAGRLEEIDSAPTTESESDGDEHHHQRRATETQPLLSENSKQHYANGQTSRKRTRSSQDLGHVSHKHRQPKSTEKAHGHSHGDLNIRGIFLHVMGDALGNVGVIASALIIWLTDYSWRFYFDPLISLVITVIILLSAIPLCRAASRILLQAVPAGLEIDDIKDDIESLKGVVSCHHVHVWQLNDTKLVASLHVQLGFDFEGAGKKEYMRLAKEVRTCLHEYGIHSSTVQPEFCLDETHNHVGDAKPDSNNRATDGTRDPDTCLLECGDTCVGETCCVPDSVGK